MADRRRPRTRGRTSSADADEQALRLLRLKPRTVTELRDALLASGHAVEAVEEIVARFAEAGYLDDLRLADHYIVTRADRKGHGRERILSELVRRGVDPAVARRAWDRVVADSRIDPDAALEREVRKRLATARLPLDERGYVRMYNALLRAGFEPGAIESALEPYRSCTAEPGFVERKDDDLA
jgi:regulatory protein